MLGRESMESAPFDAAEKLLEIELRRGSPSLRRLGLDAWKDVVGAAYGTILETREGRAAVAHVLAESSLFVRDRSMSLLTCGRTDLGRAFEALVARIGHDAIEGVRLSRERDRFPDAVRSSFDDDVAVLSRVVDGDRLASTLEDAELHSFEFGSLRASLDFRVFCRGLSPEVRRVFVDAPVDAPPLFHRLKRAFRAEVVQLHQFEPTGFSMNLLDEDVATCVHVSPEEAADVASFETSSRSPVHRLALLGEAERIFAPARIAVTLDGRRLVSAAEARERLSHELTRRGDARVL